MTVWWGTLGVHHRQRTDYKRQMQHTDTVHTPQITLISGYIQRELLRNGKGIKQSEAIRLPKPVRCCHADLSGPVPHPTLRWTSTSWSSWANTPRSTLHQGALTRCDYLIFNWCLSTGTHPQERKLFDERFVRLDTRVLCELTSAADALEMKALVDLTSRALARLIEGKVCVFGLCIRVFAPHCILHKNVYLQ